MGIDLLDISFRIEREFGVRLEMRDLVFPEQREKIQDPTAGQLFEFLLRSLPDLEHAARPTDEDLWRRLQLIIADVCFIPPTAVIPTARLWADLGCE